ncbi:MAG: mechanosensitive ion channel [Ignavibacteria bacterium]|nr:mechanosensitive ion channel [Ignavibacteria bacterium]
MENIYNEIISNPIIRNIIYLIIGIVIILVVAGFIRRQVSKHISDIQNRYRTRKFITFISYILIILLATVIYSNKLGGLTVALGVAGAGIAFALQEVIVSFAGWLALLSNNFYRTGDRVQLGGIMGDVIDIGILRTTLMELGQWVNGDNYNGRIVFVANSFVFKEPVYNYSGDYPFLWDEIKIPIQYGSDYKLAREIIKNTAEKTVGEYGQKSKKAWEEIVKKYMIENAKTEPMITMIINDNWVEYTLRYVVNYKARRTTKDLLSEEILNSVEATKGKVKFASATFHLVEAPEIKIKLSQTRQKRMKQKNT